MLGRAGTGQLIEQSEFVVVVNDDPPDARVERVREFGRRLAVAVEADLLGLHASGQGDVQLAGRDNIETKAFFDQDLYQGRAEPRFRGVMGACARHLRLEVVEIVAACLTDRVFVVDVERRAVLVSEFTDITAADLENAVLVVCRVERQHITERIKRCLNGHGATCALATLRTLSEWVCLT